MWSPAQLAFSGIASLVLYGAFVFIQTIRHRDYFLAEAAGDDVHAPPPSAGQTWASVALLARLPRRRRRARQDAVAVDRKGRCWTSGRRRAVVGIIIAALVLLPEGLAAARAAHADKLQTSLNLAFGSALASIGLTIPVIAAIFIVTGRPLVLGLEARRRRCF